MGSSRVWPSSTLLEQGDSRENITTSQSIPTTPTVMAASALDTTPCLQAGPEVLNLLDRSLLLALRVDPFCY